MTGHQLPTSVHAATRIQQRSIPELAVEWVMDFGVAERRGHADVYALNKKGRRALRREIGDVLYRYVAPILAIYVVVSDDGAIITTARRLKSIKRN